MEMTRPILLSLGVLALLAVPPLAKADESATHAQGHRTVTGQVIDKAGGLYVQTPDGATFQINPQQSQRHGHAAPKAGDEVRVMLNENNQVMEIHPKGEGGDHRFVTGNLVHVGQMRGEIKLKTPDGEQTFPLDRQDLKTKPLEDGARVTVELNEAGRVVDLHRD